MYIKYINALLSSFKKSAELISRKSHLCPSNCAETQSTSLKYSFVLPNQADLNQCLQSPDQHMNSPCRDHYCATHWHINACWLLYCGEVCVCVCMLIYEKTPVWDLGEMGAWLGCMLQSELMGRFLTNVCFIYSNSFFGNSATLYYILSFIISQHVCFFLWQWND